MYIYRCTVKDAHAKRDVCGIKIKARGFRRNEDVTGSKR